MSGYRQEVAGHTGARVSGGRTPGNGDLAGRVLVPVSQTIPAPPRYTLFHRGRGQMLDHLLVTRNLLGHYPGTEIHNEILHDESVVFGTDRKRPESDQTAMVATFESADNAATWSPTTSA